MSEITAEMAKALVAENERLFKLLERMVDQMLPLEEIEDLPGYSRVLTAEVLLAERDKLKAENESLRNDAERYRWLRANQFDALEIMEKFVGEQMEYVTDEELDDAIDAAIISPENP